MKTILLIDGENFKSKIKTALNGENIVWHKFDFDNLFKLVLDGYEIDKIIFYFAKLKFYKKTKEKSEKLIEN